MKRRNWTRDELKLAINLYCKTPFGKIHNRNPDIIRLAELLDRTPNAVSYKLANFSSIDPSLERKGASHVSKLDLVLWDEFFENWEKLAFESEQLLAKLEGRKILELEDCLIALEGKDKDRVARYRVNQAFFRTTVLASYDVKCCITGISIPDLLIGSHIIPWAVDKINRLNPRNGLCLNSFHDKAFDTGIISLTDDLKVIVSTYAKEFYNNKPEREFLLRFENLEIRKPKRFIPDREFLEFHRNNIYKG